MNKNYVIMIQLLLFFNVITCSTPLTNDQILADIQQYTIPYLRNHEDLRTSPRTYSYRKRNRLSQQNNVVLSDFDLTNLIFFAITRSPKNYMSIKYAIPYWANDSDLHIALKIEDHEYVTKLLENIKRSTDTSILTQIDRNGDTPMHIAARKGKVNLLEQMKLIAPDAYTTLTNKEGKTAESIWNDIQKHLPNSNASSTLSATENTQDEDTSTTPTAAKTISSNTDYVSPAAGTAGGGAAAQAPKLKKNVRFKTKGLLPKIPLQRPKLSEKTIFNTNIDPFPGNIENLPQFQSAILKRLDYQSSAKQSDLQSQQEIKEYDNRPQHIVEAEKEMRLEQERNSQFEQTRLKTVDELEIIKRNTLPDLKKYENLENIAYKNANVEFASKNIDDNILAKAIHKSIYNPEKNHYRYIKSFIPDWRNDSDLHIALKIDDFNHVRLLLNSFNVHNPEERNLLITMLNIPDSHGNTPLHIAARKNLRDLFDDMISKGADSTIQNSKKEIASNLFSQ